MKSSAGFFCSTALHNILSITVGGENEEGAGSITEKLAWVVFHWYNHRNTGVAVLLAWVYRAQC